MLMYKYTITGKTYKDYSKWRKGPGYILWRNRQYKAQRGKCFYCECLLKNRRTNVDHVIPVKKRGTNRAKNFVLSCGPCNKEKGNRRPTREERIRASKLTRRGF